MNRSEKIKAQFYPETNVGGFTSIDGTIEFYTRINALIKKEMKILDFGAGRASWMEEDDCEYRKTLLTLKGKANYCAACDIDPIVKQNQNADETFLITIGEALPFDDETFDIVISDYTFEHIAEPDNVIKEFNRILKPGGWICARTPNQFGYVSIITRLVKNSLHSRLLKYAQPNRKALDVFPTTFKLNTLAKIEKNFPSSLYNNYTYRYESEPGYFFNNRAMFFLMMWINRLLPRFMISTLFIFVQKK